MLKRNSDNNSKNDIYITLKGERNYYQGDIISGAVVLDLQSVKKTQSVKITLEGIALIHNKPTTIYTTTLVLMEPPEGEKFTPLEAHTHTYNFHLNAPSSKALPSTLEIPQLMTVQYRLVAVQQVQFGLLDFTKVHPTAEKEVNILEHIDVNEFPVNYNEMRDIALVGLEKKVRVVVDMLKCAAVKGATIPISITIHHVGVMVKDRAIRVRLFRNVFYQNTRLNLDGPELITSTNGDIMIIGPTEFTATTKLKLAIPSKICPTVEETGKTFKVEYIVNVVINLNEESPHLKQREEEIVIFDIPFTIGTYPHLDYCIDDDDEEEKEEEEQGVYNGVYDNKNNSTIHSNENNNNDDAIEDKSNDSQEQEKNQLTNQDSVSTDTIVKAIDQINIEPISEPVPPEIIEQEEPSMEEYKPDQVPTKQKTMPYESGLQLPVYIENDPVLPEQMMQDEPERNEQDIEKKETKESQREEQVPSLPQQLEDQVVFPQIKQKEEEEVSLPIQVPSSMPHYYYQDENKRPMMTNAYSSTSSSENATSYLPTPRNSSRPSSPSPTYHIPYGISRNSSNTSFYQSDINNSAPELPIEIDPRLEKSGSYLSNIPPRQSPPPLPARPFTADHKPPIPSRPSYGTSPQNGIYYNVPTMPMPMPNHSYPEPPFTMPQPHQHYYHH